MSEELEEEEVTIYTLVSDDGDELDFELLEVLEVTGKKYGIFAPFVESKDETEGEAPTNSASKQEDEEDEEEEDGLLILRLVRKDDEDVFEVIDDEEEFARVADELDKMSESGYLTDNPL